jgi:hypothetical protein
VDPVDDLMLGVALTKFEFQSQFDRYLLAVGFDVGKRKIAGCRFPSRLRLGPLST